MNSKSKKRKELMWVLIFILMISIIFYFSSQSGEQSNQISETVYRLFGDETGITDDLIGTWTPHNLFRKFGHIFIYSILGMVTYTVIKLKIANNKLSMIIALLICYIIAVLDEKYQLQTGRTSKTYDIVIDCIGAMIGITTVKILSRIKRK